MTKTTMTLFNPRISKGRLILDVPIDLLEGTRVRLAAATSGVVDGNRTSFEARVRSGRLVLDVPSDLPEGTEIPFIPVSAGGADSGPTELERRELEEAFRAADEDQAVGRLEDVIDFARRLKRYRGR